MPTYGYHCPRCQAEFEVLQSMADDPVADCPTCGGPGRRLFYPAGIVFKGSGFYKTDSRARSTSSSAAEKKSGAGKEAATASSPAATADAGKTAPASGGTTKKAAAGSTAAPEA